VLVFPSQLQVSIIWGVMEFTGERMIPKINEGEVVWAEHYARYILSSFFIKGKVVLDVACGSGYGSFYLAEKGAKKVFGIDNSEETIKYAKRTYPHPKVEYSVGDALDLKLPGNSIDVVVSFETIEHVPDHRRFLGEVKRVLKKDGLLIISTPNKGVFPPGNPFHTKEFTFKEFKTTLEEFFKNIEVLCQDNWITSGILKSRTVKSASISKQLKRVNMFKLFGKDPKTGLYLLALCSDAPIPRREAEVAALYAFATGVDEWMRKQRVAEERLQKQILCLITELENIYRSRAWRLVTILRRVKHQLPFLRRL